MTNVSISYSHQQADWVRRRLGKGVIEWLDALEELILHLERRKSVNLAASSLVKWKALIEAAGERLVGGLPAIDLNDPILSSRPAFLNAWLKVLGVRLC